jgi:hypothetical protein
MSFQSALIQFWTAGCPEWSEALPRPCATHDARRPSMASSVGRPGCEVSYAAGKTPQARGDESILGGTGGHSKRVFRPGNILKAHDAWAIGIAASTANAAALVTRRKYSGQIDA